MMKTQYIFLLQYHFLKVISVFFATKQETRKIWQQQKIKDDC